MTADGQARTDAGFSLVEVLVVMAILGILAGFVVPVISNTVSGYRLRNEAKAISNMVSLAKMRATSQFSRARVYGDLSTNQYRLQVWNKTTNQWVTEGATRTMPFEVRFGFGVLGTPPPNTQPAIAMGTLCTDDAGADVGNTNCIVFNSRGIPVNAGGAPLGGNAFYMTDRIGVRAVTVTATPLVREWWSPAHSPMWVRQ
jgi:prepilin-type N-terminal cleavage/methylation domain-containing protein